MYFFQLGIVVVPILGFDAGMKKSPSSSYQEGLLMVWRDFRKPKYLRLLGFASVF